MNDAVLDALRHNAWATRRLLALCRDLSDEQLAASSPTAFGSILATLGHLIQADHSWAWRLVASEGAPPNRGEDARAPGRPASPLAVAVPSGDRSAGPGRPVPHRPPLRID